MPERRMVGSFQRCHDAAKIYNHGGAPPWWRVRHSQQSNMIPMGQSLTPMSPYGV